MIDAEKSAATSRRVIWRDVLAIAAVYLAFGLLIGPRIPYDQFNVSPYVQTHGQNIALAETMAWRNGRLALGQDFYEDAEFEGNTYSVVGLAFTIIAVPITAIADALGCETHFPRFVYFLLMTIPIPLVAYLSLRGFTPTRLWATLLAIAFVCGTPMGPEIASSRSGNIYDINHVIAVTGIFLFAVDLLGPRRIWPAAIGLIFACWSRQMTCLYFVPLILVAWRTGVARSRPSADSPAGSLQSDGLRINAKASMRYRPVAIALVGVVIAGGIPLVLNYLKFGNPLDTGYVHLYADRTDPIAERARSALFSIRYLPLHLWAMHLDYPHWEIRQGKLFIDLVDVIGGSLWLTTPLALGIFGTARKWWHRIDSRILVLGTIPVIIGLHLYHTTGGPAGMYRYALDFLPIWWLVIAPYTTSSSSAKRLTIVAVAYSILYYQVLHW
ncbi:MAG: hypothetical protein H6818_19800 [Phycisphaerales bacterium]|nr:hypothetical protein [Phycisphaerales bacterium]